MSTVRAELPALTIRRGPEAVTVVRALARVVLIVGVLVLGFVAYEFGVTSFFATRAQAGLEADFVARADTIEIASVPYTPTEAPSAPFEVPAMSFDPTTVPGLDPISVVDPIANSDSIAPSDPVAVVPVATELPGEEVPAALLKTEPLPPSGDALGRIVIPAAGVDWTVVEGVTRSDLKSGAGHMPGTALPGQPGNAVISGHRTTYGAPFLHLDRLGVGDVITVETATGTHVYQVVETLIVDPSDTWVTGQWSGAWLTLTTCEPVLSSAQRLVVVATLVAGPNAGVILDG